MSNAAPPPWLTSLVLIGAFVLSQVPGLLGLPSCIASGSSSTFEVISNVCAVVSAPQNAISFWSQGALQPLSLMADPCGLISWQGTLSCETAAESVCGSLTIP